MLYDDPPGLDADPAQVVLVVTAHAPELHVV